MIPLFKVYMNELAIEFASDILRSGYIGQGKVVDQFENKLSDWFEHPYVVTTNTGTSALHLALYMLKYYGFAGLPGSNKVLTSPMTCSATNMPIVVNGYDIVWVDIDPDTLLMDLDDLEKKIDYDTRIIIIPYWGGACVDLEKLDAIRERCYRKHGFHPVVIEDCAHAFGTTYRGIKVGRWGNWSMFSLQAIKHITSIDGGVLLLPGETHYEVAKLMRWYGIDRENNKNFRCDLDIKVEGFKFHMNDVCAAVGLSNFKDIEWILEKHRDNARYYNERLKGVDGVTSLSVDKDVNSAYWLYTILVDRRDDFIKAMADRGVAVSQVHERNDKFSCFNKYETELPNLDKVSDKIVNIPVGWWVTAAERIYIVQSIKEGW